MYTITDCIRAPHQRQGQSQQEAASQLPLASPPEPTDAPPSLPPTELRQPFADLAAQHGKAPQQRHGYWWETGPVVLSGGEEQVRCCSPTPLPDWLGFR